MDRYPLVSALSRPLIVKHLVAAAKYHGATTVAHGCTGKGNDQVRFEVGIGALAPDLQVLAPVRDSGMTRDKAIAFAEENGLPIDVDQEVAVLDRPERLGPRGRDRLPRGHLERPHRGRLRLHRRTRPSPRDADEVDHRLHRRRARRRSTAGRSPCCRPSRSSTPRAGAQGVGRLDMVEDRLVGIKSREVYEAPGAIALITAHQELENVTVERDLARFKRTVGQRWAELVYDGLWFSPLKRALDAFVAESQQHVTGEVRMTLHGGRRRRHRPAQRGLALRLRPRHLRHRRHVRPVARQGLRRAVGHAVQAGRGPGPAARRSRERRRRSQPTRLWGGRFGGGPSPAMAALSKSTDVRLAARALRPGRRRGRTPACCTAPACSPTTSWPRCSARSTELSAEVADGDVRAASSPTRTCTRRSSAG